MAFAAFKTGGTFSTRVGGRELVTASSVALAFGAVTAVDEP